MLCLLATAALKVVLDHASKQLTVAEHTVNIPGITGEYDLIFLADMHIVVESDEVEEESRETVSQRSGLFADSDGTASASLWADMARQLDSFHADAILMGGDMIDFASNATIECLKQGLKNIQTPWMYVRADHDYGVWYGTMEKDEAKALHAEIDENKRVYSMDMGEFLIVGVNNNTSQISQKALNEIKSLFSQGKPVILMLHVPLESRLDDELNQKSKEVWQDRALIWGEDTYYEPNENTQAFLDLVYAKDSPVREVLSGHLHFLYDGDLTDTVHQHVVNPAYLGEIILVHVRGEK
ncbi:MAG: metallophosphoesterase [Eubacteriales bacterium]|nr:metallophosphoesterase [Eubacteriales bacterium]